MPVRRPSPTARAVLELLADGSDGWRHGYELSQPSGVASGTLSPLLMRLADRGFLESKWEQPSAAGRPPRHLYRLTKTGKQYAADTARSAPRAAPRPARGSA